MVVFVLLDHFLDVDIIFPSGVFFKVEPNKIYAPTKWSPVCRCAMDRSEPSYMNQARALVLIIAAQAVAVCCLGTFLVRRTSAGGKGGLASTGLASPMTTDKWDEGVSVMQTASSSQANRGPGYRVESHAPEPAPAVAEDNLWLEPMEVVLGCADHEIPCGGRPRILRRTAGWLNG